LRASIHDIILLPIDGLGAEVAGHVTDHELTFRHLFVGEVFELKALNSLIVAVVEILGFRIYLPLVRSSQVTVLGGLVVGDLCNLAILLDFIDGGLRPSSSCQIVG